MCVNKQQTPIPYLSADSDCGESQNRESFIISFSLVTIMTTTFFQIPRLNRRIGQNKYSNILT